MFHRTYTRPESTARFPTSVQVTRKGDIFYIYRAVDFGLVLSLRAKEVCINDMTFVLDETKVLTCSEFHCSEIALFRISSMTNSFQYDPRWVVLTLQFGTGHSIFKFPEIVSRQSSVGGLPRERGLAPVGSWPPAPQRRDFWPSYSSVCKTRERGRQFFFWNRVGQWKTNNFIHNNDSTTHLEALRQLMLLQKRN